jgi:hypothetical protein
MVWETEGDSEVEMKYDGQNLKGLLRRCYGRTAREIPL